MSRLTPAPIRPPGVYVDADGRCGELLSYDEHTSMYTFVPDPLGKRPKTAKLHLAYRYLDRLAAYRLSGLGGVKPGHKYRRRAARRAFSIEVGMKAQCFHCKANIYRVGMFNTGQHETWCLWGNICDGLRLQLQVDGLIGEPVDMLRVDIEKLGEEAALANIVSGQDQNNNYRVKLLNGLILSATPGMLMVVHSEDTHYEITNGRLRLYHNDESLDEPQGA